MQALQTASFRKAVKRLHANQKADLDQAVRAVLENPAIGEQKAGDLAWLRVYKFRMTNQLTLLGYESAADDRIILHAVGGHENFYRDVKAR